jgi:phosphoglycerate dehydrogenase-like enzyme/predicted dehydrogenase
MTKETPSRALRALVIGAGGMSQHTHLPILARLRAEGRIELAVICDLQRERAVAAKERFGFLEMSADARACIGREDIDAVYIFASATLHHEYGLTALEHGKHLFVEKPIAPSYGAALELAAKAAARGVIACGGHNRRFFPSLAAARAEIGRAGFSFIEATFHKPVFDEPARHGGRTWLTANGIHALDAILFLAGGVPSQLASFAGSVGTDEARNFSAVMSFPGGGQAAFVCNNSAGSRKEEYVLHGIGRTYTATSTPGAGRLLRETATETKETRFDADAEGFEAEHRAFLAAVEGGVSAPHEIAKLAPSLFVAELIEGGFSGPVVLPRVEAARVQVRSESRVAAGAASVLVINPAALLNALPKLAAEHRVVPLEELCSTAEARDDIRAAVIGRGGRGLDRELLAKMPRLEIVGVAGLSLFTYAPEPLFERGVAVVNGSDAYARTVAEFVLGLALLGRRRAFLSHEVMRRGGWGVTPPPSGYKRLLVRGAQGVGSVVRNTRAEALLKGPWRRAKTAMKIAGPARGGLSAMRDFRGVSVGLVGWSANAAALVELLRAFDAKVSVFSEHAEAEEIAAMGARKAPLREVLAADIVSLHRGLNAETRGFIGAAELALLRPGAVLVNAARGALIDETALIARLKRGDIVACLDVFHVEPPARSHPLRALTNVFLTSHIAGGTSDMYEAAGHEAVDKVLRYLNGEPVRTISAAQWRMMG